MKYVCAVACLVHTVFVPPLAALQAGGLSIEGGGERRAEEKREEANHSQHD